MKGTCPNCGAEVEVRRRPVGSGTVVDTNTPLTFTEKDVLDSVDSIPQTVREVQNRMMQKNVRKNYHQVQAALSTLVYRQMVAMNVKTFPPRYWR